MGRAAPGDAVPRCARWACWTARHGRPARPACRITTLRAPSVCPAVGEKARTLGLLLAAGGAYAAWQQLPLEQALNAFISVLVFNIIYDLLIRCGVLLESALSLSQ